VLAPLLGSILYAVGGITVPFYTFGCIFILNSVFIFKIIPDGADNMTGTADIDVAALSNHKLIGYKDLLLN
jgi:hypothetical protein